jgi:hypothetical protein
MGIKLTRALLGKGGGVLKSYPLTQYWGLGGDKAENVTPQSLEEKGFSKAQALAYSILIAKVAKTDVEARLLFFIYSGDADKSTDGDLVRAAYDVMLKLDGFKELEFRCDGVNSEPYHLDNSSYEEYSKNSDVKLIMKGEMFRRMRIFAHNWPAWPKPQHKDIWLLHCDSGLTLQEIGEKHYFDQNGKHKKVSKCWLSALFKKYRSKMDEFFIANPYLLIDDTIEYEEGYDDISSMAYMDND